MQKYQDLKYAGMGFTHEFTSKIFPMFDLYARALANDSFEEKFEREFELSRTKETSLFTGKLVVKFQPPFINAQTEPHWSK